MVLLPESTAPCRPTVSPAAPRPAAWPSSETAAAPTAQTSGSWVLPTALWTGWTQAHYQSHYRCHLLPVGPVKGWNLSAQGFILIGYLRHQSLHSLNVFNPTKLPQLFVCQTESEQTNTRHIYQTTMQRKLRRNQEITFATATV